MWKRIWNFFGRIRGLVFLIALLSLAVNAVLLFNPVKRFVLGEHSAAQRGYKLAREQGCFTCHGPNATKGVAQFEGNERHRTVPALNGDDMLEPESKDPAANERSIYQWIHDGLPETMRNDPREMADQRTLLLRMRAYGRRLSESQIMDLVAFVKASYGLPPIPENQPDIQHGEDLTITLGCVQCHGPRGIGGEDNPRSFKGYIPGWQGSDFRELVHNDDDLVAWIKHGRVDWIMSNPVTNYFFRRQLVKMPEYDGKISDADIRALVAYMHWLQQNPSGGP